MSCNHGEGVAEVVQTNATHCGPMSIGPPTRSARDRLPTIGGVAMREHVKTQYQGLRARPASRISVAGKLLCSRIRYGCPLPWRSGVCSGHYEQHPRLPSNAVSIRRSKDPEQTPGESEFCWGSGLVAPELAEKPPSKGGRYQALCPPYEPPPNTNPPRHER